MSSRRKSPIVLVSTAASVNSILTRNYWIDDSETEIQKNSARERQEHHVEQSGAVLAAGLLLWEGRGSSGPGALAELLERRHGGKESGIFDESTTVGVCASVLRRLSISSGSWVIIKDTSTNLAKPARVIVLDPPEPMLPLAFPGEVLSSQDGPRPKSFPIYSLVSSENQQPDPEVAFLSPVLAFNLGIHVSWLEFLTSCAPDSSKQDAVAGESRLQIDTANPSTGRYAVDISPFLAVLERPFSDNTNVRNGTVTHSAPVSRIRYATHMRIGLVRIPVENGLVPPQKGRQAEIDAALQDYFKIDRFLATGDVFSVQLVVKHGLLEVHDIDQHGFPSSTPKLEYLFFKVVALEPSGEALLCANRDHTALVLGGSVASQLPPLTRSTHLRNVFLRTAPVQELASLLAPCLHPRVLPLQFRLSVLMHGPSGSGKQTIVRLAAEELGLHVVEYNCYDFIGASEGKTTAALLNSFKSAKRYSPSVLLLRRVEAFGKSSSVGSSPSDQLGAVAQVTSVLKKCIIAHSPSTSQENQNNRSDWSFDEPPVDTAQEDSSFTMIKSAGMKIRSEDGMVLVVATCESAEILTPALRRCFTHELVIGMPNEDQRRALLHHYLGLWDHQREVRQNMLDESMVDSLKVIAAQTSGLTPRDLRSVAADAGAVATIRSSDSSFSSDVTTNTEGIVSERGNPVQVSTKDLETVLERVKLRTASAIGTPKVPNVKWEDVGGLEDVKKAILDTVQLPLVHKELFSSGLRQRSGVLLYGPPGTGKTLLAKAVATECALNFLSVKGPELINMYIGESEKNVRDIFYKARAARPCVVFFDELDALAPARGASGDSGGVMDRVVSQMLAEIDGVSDTSQDLFIIGASNRPDLIDPALLRPGRFDKLLYVGVSSEDSYRERVLEALTRKFKLDKNVSLKELAQKCPVTYTGADMYALCADAWQQAVKREVSTLERRKGSNGTADIETVAVKQEDFIKAMRELTPSLSRAELDRYERLRAQFQGQRPVSSSLSEKT